MSGEAGSPRRRLLPAIVGIAIVAIVIGAAWYLVSTQFHDYARGRLVARLESMTGGRVELGKLEWNASKLSLVADSLTIHGLEGPNETPYVHADRVALRLKILSLAGRQIGLRYFELDRPVIHLIVHSDGSTNQPTPKAAQPGSGWPLQQLFALQADRVEVRDGVLLINDTRVPLDLSAKNLQAQMAYAAASQRYDGSFSAGAIRLAYGDYKPFDSSLAANFSLAHNHLDVKSVKLSTGNSAVDAAGRVDDFSHPRLTLNYRALLDLAQIADITRLAQVRGGVLEVKGSGAFTAEDFTTSGSVRVQNLEYRDPDIRIPDLDGGAEFKSEHGTLTIPHLFAHALGGNVTGNMEIRHWTSALKPGARLGMVSPAADGVARLRLQDLSVSRIATAISTPTLPADKLNPVGSASGSMDITFRGSPAHAHARFDVEVAPVQASPQQLPVSATIRGSYAIDTLALELAQVNATARSLTLEASGTMAHNNNLRVALKVGNLPDLDALLAPLSAPHRLPDGMTGRATFTGNLTGTVAAPQFAGELALADFTLPVPLKRPVKAQQPPARLAHFDSFTAELQYSPSQLVLSNARLRRGAEDLSFTITAALDKGEFKTALPLTLRAEIHNFQANDLLGLLGFDYPLTGMTSASLRVKGPADDPVGSGHFRIANATFDGEPYQNISADVVFADQEAQLSNLLIAHNGARVTGTAAYNLKTTAFRCNVQGNNFSLAQFKLLQFPRLSVAGMLNFDARGSGTISDPVIDADLHIRAVTLNRERMGNLDAKAVTSGGVMRITAHSDVSAEKFALDGSVGMHGDFPAELALRFTRLDVGVLLHEYLQGRVTGHSSMTGAVTLAGPLRQPRLLTVNGDISQLSVDMENVRVRNDGPVRFKVAGQVLTLEQFHLAGEENTQMSATGTIALAGDKALELRAEGNVYLKLLQIWNPNLHSGGMVEFNINARGNMSRPVLFGRAKINGGALTHTNFPNGLSDINGVIVFNQDRMQIQSLTAATGGGTLALSGFVSYANALAFNLTAQGKNIRLRYPQGISTVLDCDLRLSGTTSTSTLSGTATVTRFGMTPQFDLALAIARARQAPEAPNPKSPLLNMRLAVHVVSTPELEVQSSLARLTGDIDLNLRGTVARPVLLGRVNITEGQITLNGTTYQLERGDVAFSNPVRIEPLLDVAATTRVREYDITLGFHGPVDRLSITYRSDPPLPTSDIIALLAFGRTREESVRTTEANPSFTESASSAILSQALNSAASTRMQRLFGVSRIKISPEVAGAEAFDPNARLTIEQQVSRDFTVTYVTDLTHSAQQIIQVEYNYSRNLSILATRDQYGVLSFDVRIKRRRR